MADSNAKPVSRFLRQVLELGPTIAFFLIYLQIRDDFFEVGGTEYSGFIVATLIFAPILLAAMGVLWMLTGRLSRIQILTAFMVIFFGGLTAWFNDERFFKMKTSIVYGCLAGILGIGLLQGRSYLAFVLAEVMPMQNEGWMILTRRLCMAFATLAVANEIIWRTMSTDLWIKIETFGFPVTLFVFLWAQIVALQSYMIDPDGDASDR
ncbi:MAG: septation protein IspZ [Rhodobacteraceae bacterium]|nr:septation protein IspZ [Paracoccaceae bacterium]